MRIGTKGSDDHIGKAIAVDIAGTGDRTGAKVIGGHAVEAEAIAAVKSGEIDRGGKARWLAENHIARSRFHPVRIGTSGADDHIGKAVAIDIASATDRRAAKVAGRYPVEPEAIAAVKGREIDAGGKLDALPKTT